MEFLSSFSKLQYCYDAAISQIPIELLVYTHVPTALAALLFGFYLLKKDKSIPSRSLFLVSFFFFLWSIFDLTTWFVFIGADITMFAWSLIDLTSVLFFFFTYRFLYSFSHDSELPLWQLILSILLISPTVFTTLLGMNLVGFDTTTCEAVENVSVVSFTYIAQAFFIVATGVVGFTGYRHNRNIPYKQSQVILASLGSLLFLLFFFLVNLFVLFLVNNVAIDYAYNFSLYGLFGMPVLLAFLGYLIVKFKTFNIKLIGAQALVVALWILIGALLLVVKSPTSRVIAFITFALALTGGYFLIRSVKREVEQRERIELLAKQLQIANTRLQELDKMKSEFVSIASHQLRSPLTSIRGYASMLADGTYGKLTTKQQDIAEKIADSSKYMAMSIEDYLNVSRIEAGNMKYEISDFSLKEVVEKVVDEIRPIAMKKGLILVFRSNCNSDECMVRADIGKTRQIVTNLIDNSMKYTPKGTITVVVQSDSKMKFALVTIKDTGVGMNEETLESLFNKFVRARNANSINVTGTGLGLYIAKKMANDMNGEVWAESEGEQKGSMFHIQLPNPKGRIPKK